MKRIMFLAAFALFALTSCSSDEPGPTGPQGPPGEPGLLGTVFDVPVDFTAANDYSAEITYSDYTDVEIFESDVVLVYLRVGTDGEVGGEPVYVWRLLPQTYYLENGGTMQYNYDYTFFETLIFLDSSEELSSLGPEFTDDQVFRVAILPADFAQDNAVDVSNYNEVISAMKVQEKDIPVLDIK